MTRNKREELETLDAKFEKRLKVLEKKEQDALDALDAKFEKRLKVLEKKEQDREDKAKIAKFVSKIKTYTKLKGCCPKCDGKMKVFVRTTVQYEACNRVRYDYGISSRIPVGDDKREVLKLVCEDCRETFYMWAKTEKEE